MHRCKENAIPMIFRINYFVIPLIKQVVPDNNKSIFCCIITFNGYT